MEILIIVAVIGIAAFFALKGSSDKLDLKLAAMAEALEGKRTGGVLFDVAGVDFKYSGKNASLCLFSRGVSKLEITLYENYGFEAFIYAKACMSKDTRTLAMRLIKTADTALNEKFEIYTDDEGKGQKAGNAVMELGSLAEKGFLEIKIERNSIKVSKAAPDLDKDLEPDNIRAVLAEVCALVKAFG